VGLPNAGKTSLLNALTGASAKIGAYAFTTLDPNLGMLYGYVLADIPGLIEGAAGGKGLGFKFLRHIARTRLLVHCVSLESEDPIGDYKTVRAEMSAFEKGALAHKDEKLVLTKADTRTPEEIKKVQKAFKTKFKKEAVVVSVLDDAATDALKTALIAALR
jgi:GTP-binding protein